MEQESGIKESVLAKIRTGEISMRPRLYFILQALLIAVLMLFTAAISAFALSFILFGLRESGEQILLGFGVRGLVTFATLFPWSALALVVLLLILIEWLMRYFRFGYRRPVLRAFGALLTGALLIGLAIDATPLHPFLLSQADRGELPIIGELYESIRAPHRDQGIFRGVITEIQGTQLTVTHDDNDRDTDDGTWTVAAPQGYVVGALHVGELVFVAGTPTGSSTLAAYGIEEYGPQ